MGFARHIKRASLTFLLVLGTGMIAGARPTTFLVAACVVCGVRWGAYLHRPSARRRYFILDPETPDPKSLASALSAVFEETLRSQKTILFRLAAFTANPRFRPRLNLTPKGEVEISGIPRRQLLPHPGIWLADHPLPFDIPLAHSLTLVFTPCAGARVRVTEDIPNPLPTHVWIGIVLLITIACVFSCNHMLAAVLAFTGETYLMRR